MLTFDLDRPDTFEAEFTASRGTMGLTLRRPATDEYMTLASRYKLGTANPNWSGMLKHIADHWWVGFKDANDRSGSAIPNTPENRLKLLQVSEPLVSFILTQLRAEAGTDAEGNAASGSV
jgi:hypothetical protein